MHPAHAVEDGGIFGRQLVGLLDQLQRFRQAHIAFGQRVAQGVVGVGVVGLHGDDFAEIRFQHVETAQFFCCHGPVVEQIRRFGLDLDACAQHVDGLFILFRVAQDLRFRHEYLARLLGAAGA